MRAEEFFSVADLRAYFTLDADGVLYWKARPGGDRGTRAFNGRFAGKRAGAAASPDRHIDVRITTATKSFAIKAHRIVVALCDGEWPPLDMDVDHIDGNPHNNRRSNLRVCTRQQNVRNMKLKRANRYGLKGVSYNKRDRKWYATCRRGRGKPQYIGVFDDPIAAARAYDRVAVATFGEFARTNAMLGLAT